MRERPRHCRILAPLEQDAPVAVLDPLYLSVTVDTSLFLGGSWWGPSRGVSAGVSLDRAEPLDLESPRLLRLARALSPASLRIGGTEADRVRYKSGGKAAKRLGIAFGESPGAESGHELTLGKGAWKRLHRFVKKAGFELLFNVSAGPSDRDGRGAWTEENLARLVAYSIEKRLPVAAWELGNEVNAYALIHGRGKSVGAAQYGRDFARFANLIRDAMPASLLAGPASAVWPRLGEIRPIMPRLASGPAAGFIDVLSWHYYPQQSSRGPVAVLRAGPETMLSPKNLNEARRHCRRARAVLERINRCRPPHKPARLWITETAHALYGGEPGISDRFASTLWWLDELALLAREGVSRVYRQALVGSDYGLLRESGLEPTPDYFASLLWKRTMGEEVLLPRSESKPDSALRVYLHRGERGLSLLAVNIDRNRGAGVSVEWKPQRRYLLTGGERGLLSRELLINGRTATEDVMLRGGGAFMDALYGAGELSEPEREGRFTLPPLSILILAP